jgi:hypothetical protein
VCWPVHVMLLRLVTVALVIFLAQGRILPAFLMG